MTTAAETRTERQKLALKRIFAKRSPKPYVNPYLAGAFLGIVLFLAFFITGNGLGASGGLNRIMVFFEDLIAPEHVNRVPYLINMAGGDRNPLDSWIVFVTLGVVLGGFVSGWFNVSLAGTSSPVMATPMAKKAIP